MAQEGSATATSPLSPVVRRLSPVLAATLTLSATAWAADLFRAAGIALFTEQYLAGMLGIGLALVYLHVPARKGERARLPWYDAIAAVCGFTAGAYIAVRFPGLADRVVDVPSDALIAGTVLIVLSIEGLRRTAGLTLVIVVAGFFLYALFGHLMPGAFQTRPVSVDRWILYLTIDNSGILGFPMQIGTTIVVSFVLFGQLLNKSRGAEFFNDLSVVVMGRYRGGSAKISVTASSLFGSISGIVVSNIVATGVITIPMMRRAGYSAHAAGAIEAVASTGGQLMPPVMGAVAFLMSELLQIPYGEIVVAALIPAILYYAALFIQVDLEAVRYGISRVPEKQIPRLKAVLGAGWFFILPFVVLIYCLFGLNFLPEAAALYASIALIAGAIVLPYKGMRFRLRGIVEAISETGYAVLDIIMIVSAAGMLIGTLNLSGLGFGLTLALVELGTGNLFVMLLIAAAFCIILGLGLPTVGVYILLAVLIAPSLVEVGVTPLAAHMFIFYFGMMSMITPPLAIASFFAASLAKADPIRTAFASMRFGWVAYVVPFLFVASPSLLLQGALGPLALVLATAIGGVWLVSVATTGYFRRPLGVAMRAAFAVAGLAMMTPHGIVSWGIWSDLAGLALGVAIVAWEIAATRRERPSVEPGHC